MAKGSVAKCAKAMLVIFNIIFWLSGCSLLSIGIWMRVEPSIVNTLDLFSIDEEDPLLAYAAYVLIAMGSFVFLVGFLGCCGAMKENKCMLGMYIVCLVFIMGGELTAGILALLFRDEIMATASDALSENLKNDTFYAQISGEKIIFTPFGLAMSIAQIELKCCGINNYTDFEDSAFKKKFTLNFPLTCCTMQDDPEITDGVDITNKILDTQKCIEKQDGFLNKQGCIEGLEEEFSEKALVLIGLGIGVACLELFGFALAACLCRNTGEDVD